MNQGGGGHWSSRAVAGITHRLFVFFLVFVTAWRQSLCLDCFKCGSFNGSSPECGDPFHHNHSNHYLESPCLAGWKGRQGLFPASHCIKLSGYFYETSAPMVVRGCTIDSGTITIDTELGRQSHCGLFVYDGKTVVGCLDSCNEFDACNASSQLLHQSPRLVQQLFLLLMLLLMVELLV